MNSPVEPPPERSSRMVLAVVLLAVALRCGIMLRGTGQFDDPDNYLALAQSLGEGNGLAWNGRPTAYRPPLYPLLLAPLVKWCGPRPIFAIALLHLALGAATVGLTAAAGRRWELSDRRILAAAAIVACDPVLVWQSRFIMTETSGAMLTALALGELARPRWRAAFSGGVCLGLAGLCRPSLLAGAGLIALGALMAGPGSRRERFLRSLVLALTVAAVLAPWALRNVRVLGEPVWTTTHGGYTLALANNEPYYRDILNGSPGRVWTGDDQWLWWDSVNRATAGMTEPQADRYLRGTVVKLATDQPATFFRASLDRLRRFWSAVPAGAVYASWVRWATALWTLPLWAALVLGIFRPGLWRWPQVAAPLAIAGLCLVHTLFWTDIRMRAPIVPAIALVAASAAIPKGIARAGQSCRLSRMK